MAKGLLADGSGGHRCFWAGADTDYQTYHDHEWGMPVIDDHRLYEKLCLEGFQSGLSWLTILRKRPAFRHAFVGFDPSRVARYGARDVARLLKDAGIVRHRGKIEAAIENARRTLDVIDEHGSFAAYVWRFEPPEADRPRRVTHAWLMKATQSPASVALSKDLKRRGFRFVGPTTSYAFMQAMGLVDDHLEGCSARPRCERARARLKRPR